MKYLLVLTIGFLMSCETTKNMNIEDEYVIPQGIFERQNFYVISGCSGGGKSTLLSELEHRGYKVVAEPGDAKLLRNKKPSEVKLCHGMI